MLFGFPGIELCDQLGEQETIMFWWQKLKDIGGKQLVLLAIAFVVLESWLATVVAFTSFGRGVMTFEQLGLCRGGRIQGRLPAD